MISHKLKTLPVYFKQLVCGNKTFEIRKNDRNFKVGDELVLEEFKDGEYTGMRQVRTITYILTNEEFEGLAEGYCAIGMK